MAEAVFIRLQPLYSSVEQSANAGRSAGWEFFANVRYRPIADIGLARHTSQMHLRAPQIKHVLLLAALVIAGEAFWSTRTPSMPANSVNGIYRNSCCNPVTLRNGQFTASGWKAPFELRQMKYGLEGRMDRYVVVRDGKIVLGTRSEQGGFLFADDAHSLTLCEEGCGPGREYKFKRD